MGQGPRSREADRVGTLVDGFISVANSAGFLTPPRATWPGMALLTIKADKAHELIG